MNVALFTSVFFNNIGNAFLDYGTEKELELVLKGRAHIVKVSQCQNFAASLGKLFEIKEFFPVKWIWKNLVQRYGIKQLHNNVYTIVNMPEVLSVAGMFYFDYLIIPGCVLTIHFFKIYSNFLEKKVSQGCKVIFIGASGNYYTEDEIKFVSNCLKKVKPYAIMTRDSLAYQIYKKYCEYSYNGIDNAFFVNHLNIPTLDSGFSSYDVINLELPNNEKLASNLTNLLIKENRKFVYSNHCPYSYGKIAKLSKTNQTIVSDYPLDYLTLYKNVDTIHSDRVHACIAALSMQNTAILYSLSPRIALFENVGIKYEYGQPMKLDPEKLKKLQSEQLEFLYNILI